MHLNLTQAKLLSADCWFKFHNRNVLSRVLLPDISKSHFLLEPLQLNHPEQETL